MGGRRAAGGGRVWRRAGGRAGERDAPGMSLTLNLKLDMAEYGPHMGTAYSSVSSALGIPVSASSSVSRSRSSVLSTLTFSAASSAATSARSAAAAASSGAPEAAGAASSSDPPASSASSSDASSSSDEDGGAEGGAAWNCFPTARLMAARRTSVSCAPPTPSPAAPRFFAAIFSFRAARFSSRDFFSPAGGLVSGQGGRGA